MSLQLICTSCNQIIDSSNINVAADLAKCNHCEAVHKASSLLSPRDEKSLQAPPYGSKIVMTKELNDTVLFLPRRGFSRMDIPIFLFLAVWLGFAYYWTSSAAEGGSFLAFFSIPIWVIGLVFLFGLLSSVFEHQKIYANGSRVIFERGGWFGKKRKEYNFKKIHEIKIEPMNTTSFNLFTQFKYIRQIQKSGGEFRVPSVITGASPYHFFESANEAEQQWTVMYLNKFLTQAK